MTQCYWNYSSQVSTPSTHLRSVGCYLFQSTLVGAIHNTGSTVAISIPNPDKPTSGGKLEMGNGMQWPLSQAIWHSCVHATLTQWLQNGNSSVAELKGIKEPCEDFSSAEWLRKRVKVFVQCRQAILRKIRAKKLHFTSINFTVLRVVDIDWFVMPSTVHFEKLIG